MNAVQTVGDLKKIAEGREAEMFEWGDGKVLRLYRGGFMRSSADFQTATLKAVREAGVRVPEVYATTEVDGRLGVIIERIDGIDLLTMIGRNPLKVWWVGGMSGRGQAGVNLAQAPDSIPTTHERYAAKIQGASADFPPGYADAAFARLEQLPHGDRLIHGDFHPGNLMVQDGEPVVIDWSNASRGNPEADVARTMLTLKMGDPPPGTSVVIRVAAVFARRLLLDAHVRAYRRVRKPDDELVRQWGLPVAIARLAEGIEVERPRLIRYIDKLLAQK